MVLYIGLHALCSHTFRKGLQGDVFTFHGMRVRSILIMWSTKVSTSKWMNFCLYKKETFTSLGCCNYVVALNLGGTILMRPLSKSNQYMWLPVCI